MVDGPAVAVGPAGSGAEVASASAVCPAGQKATGGGFFASVATVAGTIPSLDGSTYSVIVVNLTGVTVNVNAYAICAAP